MQHIKNVNHNRLVERIYFLSEFFIQSTLPCSAACEGEVSEVLLEPCVRPPLVLPALQVQPDKVPPLERRAQQRHLARRVLRVRGVSVVSDYL